MFFNSLTPEGDRQARRLYRKLLIFYLGVTVTVFGIGAIALYSFVSYSLRQQLQKDLQVLAEAAAPSLDIVRTDSEFFALEAAEQHWHNLQKHSQSLEWFDSEGRLLMREGQVFPSLPLPNLSTSVTEPKIERDWEQNLYVATLPINKSGELAGFVRASETFRIVNIPLRRLQWGLGIGGGLGLGAIVLSGMWLTRQSLEPFIESYQRLRQFTGDASHEMRSPLTITQAALDVMSVNPDRLSAADRTNLTRIHSATQQLRRLVEELLKLARSDRMSELKLQKIPLNELLEELVEILEDVAAEKDISLTCDELDKVTVLGDNSQLIQLFTNLIQNSIKYTPSGGTITVELFQEGKKAIATVTDTGIGIAEEDLAHVFERFWRADRSRERASGSLGLGLAIAQNTARLHHGKIKVSSQLGKGSTFTVRLPAIV